MRNKIWKTLPALLLTLAAAAEARTWEEAREEIVERFEERIYVEMRDGVRLDTNVIFPKNGEAPYPTVLIRSPYLIEGMFRSWGSRGILDPLVEKGYVIVYQNERGRYWSEGDHIYLGGAKTDGYDTLEWIANQEWSNGKVGTIGCSSSAEQQLGLSVSNHPAHAAAIAAAPGAGIGHIGPYWEQGNLFRGGAMQLLFANWMREWIYYGGEGANQRPMFPAELSREDRIRLSRFWSLTPDFGRGSGDGEDDFDYEAFFNHLPVAGLMSDHDGPVTDWDRAVSRLPADPAWGEHDFANEGDTFGAPMLWVFSWYDVAVAPNIALYNYARENTASERAVGNQVMVIGPGPHCRFGFESEDTVVGERQLGDARFDYDDLYLKWFDHLLKGEDNGIAELARVQYFEMGDSWKSGEVFPPEGTTMVDLYLSSGGRANSRHGDGTLNLEAPVAESSDGFTYDPRHPLPTLGGGACCMGGEGDPGAFDQSELELRHDVLVYTSPPLAEPMSVAGFVEVELFVSSDAKDTDFSIKLVDVYPDGRAYNLDDNILRARYREGFDRKVLMEEGEVYSIQFPPMVTANLFGAGHRIRLEVSSSNFPRYDRNLNTGGDNWAETEAVEAANRVHHSGVHVSRISLPVTGSWSFAAE